MARRHRGISRDAGRSCLSKHRHATKQEALTHLARNRREDQGSRVNPNSGELHVYQCGFCEGWHVGHPIGSTARREKTWLTRPRRWERTLEKDNEI